MKQALILITMLASLTMQAQKKINNTAKYDVVVSFGSMASGPVSDDFLKAHYKKFIKQNKVIIPAFKASGCGREGEFKVLFSLTRLKMTVKKKYLRELKLLIASQEKKNRANDPNSGNISLEYNVLPDDVSFCRNGISKW